MEKNTVITIVIAVAVAVAIIYSVWVMATPASSATSNLPGMVGGC